MTWVLLAIAIISEVIATVSLKLSEGFSKVVPTVLVGVGYLGAFVLMAAILKRGVPVGVVYGIWAAGGVALVALIGAVFLGESLTAVQLVGVVLVVGGVLALEMGGVH